MSKIAIMGNGEDLRCFLPLGFEVVEGDPYSIKEKMKRLIKNGYAVIFLTEKAYIPIKDEVYKFTKNSPCAVCVIPVFGKGSGIGFGQLRLSLIRAIGADIVFD